MNEKQPERLIQQELADELAETAATLTRLGVTLANLPLTMIPEEQRRTIRQVTGEVFRMGSMIPRAVTTMLEAREENEAKGRESLGDRLRREQGARDQASDPAP